MHSRVSKFITNVSIIKLFSDFDYKYMWAYLCFRDCIIGRGYPLDYRSATIIIRATFIKYIRRLSWKATEHPKEWRSAFKWYRTTTWFCVIAYNAQKILEFWITLAVLKFHTFMKWKPLPIFEVIETIVVTRTKIGISIWTFAMPLLARFANVIPS